MLGKPVFSGSPAEAFLVVLGLGLGAFGIGEMIPMGLVEDSLLFNPELLVIVFGSAFAHFADHAVMEGVEHYLSGIWTFGSIILFSMLGSRTDLAIFNHLSTILPIMLIGLLLRFLGICVVGFTSATMKKHGKRMAFADILFCFLSSLPRATIQGALGSWPLAHRFFSDDERTDRAENARHLISSAAKLTIICNAICGSLLLEVFGPMLLEATSARKRNVHSQEIRGQRSDRDGSYEEDDGSDASDESSRVWWRGSVTLSPDHWTDAGPARLTNIYKRGCDD